jgi:hypothetical protein
MSGKPKITITHELSLTYCFTTQHTLNTFYPSLLTGLLCYDERDTYLTPFGSPEAVAPLLRSTLDIDNSPKYQYKTVQYSYLFGCVQSHLVGALKHYLMEELKRPILVEYRFFIFFSTHITYHISHP